MRSVCGGGGQMTNVTNVENVFDEAVKLAMDVFMDGDKTPRKTCNIF